MNRTLFCVVAAALAVPALALAFDNTEPLAAQQWYLEQDQRLELLAAAADARSRSRSP